MVQPNTEYYFVVDENGNRVAAFDDSTGSDIDPKDGHSIKPIRIPDVAADKEEALEILTDATVDWDPFYE